jgi:hypothetical protein
VPDTVYPPVEEQADLEIAVEAATLEMMMIRGGYRLWVTGSVQPARFEDVPPANRGDPDHQVAYWYWAQTKTYPDSYPVCRAEDVMRALGRQQRINFARLVAIAAEEPARNLTAKIPRTIAPRETAVFMEWIDPALAKQEAPNAR